MIDFAAMIRRDEWAFERRSRRHRSLGGAEIVERVEPTDHDRRAEARDILRLLARREPAALREAVQLVMLRRARTGAERKRLTVARRRLRAAVEDAI